MSYDVDLFVIGGGSAGVRLSRMASGFGARVALAESGRLGGTCVNVGCVPKKLLVYGSEFRTELADMAGFGWHVEGVSHDWKKLFANKDAEIARLNTIYGRILERAGVVVHHGRARITDPHTVEVNGQRITAERIAVCTGGFPRRPQIPGGDLAITSDEAFELEACPKRVIVVGGGYIGLEFAGIFKGYGAEVTLVHHGRHVLRGFDQSVRERIEDEVRAHGIDLRTGSEIQRLSRTDEGIVAELSPRGVASDDLVLCEDPDRLVADVVLYAIGRVPATDGLGLDELGVERDRHGAIVVNGEYETSVPHILALGDIIAYPRLTPVALAQGMYVARKLYGPGSEAIRYDTVATAVFSQPNIGTVGLTEDEARGRCACVDVYESSFRPMKLTMTGRQEKTYMKILVDGDTDKVLGFHMIGPDAGEIIQGLAVALTCGVTKTQLDATIGIHPTAAEEFVTMRTRARRLDD
ncbi:MAG: glutathione-disulfide reductase [Deltaproteobacteria bacterium]|nr:MAG: glutathione-disulfide reductase [Deltaproteobacteria bacterium]